MLLFCRWFGEKAKDVILKKHSCKQPKSGKSNKKQFFSRNISKYGLNEDRLKIKTMANYVMCINKIGGAKSIL